MGVMFKNSYDAWLVIVDTMDRFHPQRAVVNKLYGPYRSSMIARTMGYILSLPSLRYKRDYRMTESLLYAPNKTL